MIRFADPAPGESLRFASKRAAAILLLAAAAAGGGASVFGAQNAAKAKKAAPAPVASAAGVDEQPTMILTGVRAVVSRQGQVREKIQANWAKLGETDHILNLKEMATQFYEGGAITGETASGAGTVWLADDPKAGIVRNDMLLSDQVSYRSAEAWELQTPEMRYSSKDSILSTNAGFTKMLATDENAIRATGDRFAIHLQPEGGSFQSHPKEFGNPLVYELIDKGDASMNSFFKNSLAVATVAMTAGSPAMAQPNRAGDARPASAASSPAKPVSPPAPAKSDSSTSGTATGGVPEQLKALFGSGFQRLECESLDMPPDGEIIVLGSVMLKTEQMTIRCNRLTMNQQTKLMNAVGSPVKIKQGDVNAECGVFKYDMDKKISTLDQNPVILSTDGKNTTRMVADHIILTQDPSGKTGVTMKRDPQNSKQITTITVDGPAEEKPAGDSAKEGTAQKVTGPKGPSLIKIPGAAQ